MEKKRAKEIFAAQPSESESEPEHIIELKREVQKLKSKLNSLIPPEKLGMLFITPAKFMFLSDKDTYSL